MKMDGSTRASRHYEALKNYNLGRKVGSGAFGKVRIAENKLTGLKVAIEIINYQKMREMEMEEKAKKEIKIMMLLTHPQIIRLYEIIDTPTDMYVVTEYCEHGELFDYITSKGKLQEAEACRFFQQIMSAVEYCHRNMVAHRDLKPENLLLDSEYNIKLADFGLSNVMHDCHFLKTSCGSPNYAAPEIIFGKHYAGPEVDVWSCGVILYALLCGKLPFDDANTSNLFRKIKGGIYTLPSHLSDLARDLISRMLVIDTMERITVPETREHLWFQEGLPRYLALSPDISQQAKMINEKTVREVVMLGFNKYHVHESLYNRLQNEATVAYYLLLDNLSHVTSGYLEAAYQETKERNLNQLPSTEPASSCTRHGLSGSSDVYRYRFQPHYTTESKWALGLQSSEHAHPREIMAVLLKALRELNACWKENGLYN